MSWVTDRFKALDFDVTRRKLVMGAAATAVAVASPKDQPSQVPKIPAPCGGKSAIYSSTSWI